ERPESVKTGRRIADVENEAPGWSSRSGPITTRKKNAAPMPDFIPPQLATLKARAPGGAGWVHEIKFDGYRLQARLEEGKVRLLTRSGLDWTDRFGTAVPAAIANLPAGRAILDGEMVV